MSKDPIYAPWPVLQISPFLIYTSLCIRAKFVDLFLHFHWDTQRRLKGCELRGHSEKEFTRYIRSDLLSGLVSSVLSFAVKKNVLSLSGSA